MKYQLALAALLLTSLNAQAGDEENTVTLASHQHTDVPRPHESHFRQAHNPRQGQGLYSRPDGTCIIRTVYDNGHTHVTIDAKGTLLAQKNDVVEDVQVPCP